MNEIEQQEGFHYIRTEGKMSIDWLREVTGKGLSEVLTDYEPDDGKDFPCGALRTDKCSDYRTGNGIVAIHSGRICSRTDKPFIALVADYLNNRPDLKELQLHGH